MDTLQRNASRQMTQQRENMPMAEALEELRRETQRQRMEEMAQRRLEGSRFMEEVERATDHQRGDIGVAEGDAIITTATAQESRTDRKKRERNQKKIRESIAAAREARENAISVERRAETIDGRRDFYGLTNTRDEAGHSQFLKDEEGALAEKMKAIDLQRESRLLIAEQMKEFGESNVTTSTGGTQLQNEQSYITMVRGGDDSLRADMKKEDVERRRELRIKIDALDQKIKAWDEFGKLFPMESAKRIEIMKRKEEAVVERGKLKKQREVYGMVEGAERTREQDTIDRHKWFDRASSFITFFRRRNPFSHEGARVTNPADQHVLVNEQRATFGGTKPMYIFKDANTGKEFLFKEPVNCCGLYKAQGALVTEAASKLQKRLCGEQSIAAFTVKGADGSVQGSMQERVKLYDPAKYEGEGAPPQKVDLFKWQALRQQNPDVDADDENENGKENVLPEEIKKDLLREHVLDWALCNFDTKGENFLQNADGKLVSFDKEASFSKLKEEGAQHMSETYRPHSNDTIYNTIFQDFANDKIKLDLESVLTHVQNLMQIPESEYRSMFAEMLEQKYEDPQEREAVFQKINARRMNILDEYEKFFGHLILKRQEARMKKNLGTDDYVRFLYGDRCIFTNGANTGNGGNAGADSAQG